MSCDRWWETAPIIGTVRTRPIREIGAKGSTYKIVRIVKQGKIKFYVTNQSYEPQRKCEPLTIASPMVKKFTPKRRGFHDWYAGWEAHVKGQ